MDDVLSKIGLLGLVPVVKIERAPDALPLGKALVEGELPVAEITFRTEAAEEAIGLLSREMPDLLVGAGTVLSVDQVERAVGAGARFIVSPGFNPKVVDYCLENRIPVTPGVDSPTTVEMALERGLKVVKFFPAEDSGGLKKLKAMAAPYGGIKFIPTGGINAANLAGYLAFEAVHACGGSWMVESKLISEGRFDEITRRAKEAVGLVLGFEFIHLGINMTSPEAALKSAGDLFQFFFLPVKEGRSSVFAGPAIEIIKQPGPGQKGHLAIGSSNLDRALHYLARKGVSARMDTARREGGKLKFIYLDLEIGGFAVHLIAK